MSFTAILFWIVSISCDILLVIFLLGIKMDTEYTKREIVPTIFSIISLIAVLVLWILFTTITVENIRTSSSILEGFTIYSTILSGIGVVASIVAIYAAKENRLYAALAIALSFVIYTSSALAKFYYVDVHIPYLLNRCGEGSRVDPPVCTLLGIDAVGRYSTWFNISTISLAVLLVLIFAYGVRQLLKLDTSKNYPAKHDEGVEIQDEPSTPQN